MAESHGAMNNTKWEELRLAMYGIESAPRYRCMTTSDGLRVYGYALPGQTLDYL